jgi:hypothetical protein
MSQKLSFDIKIPDGHTVQFTKESTFENFIGQFQPYCPKILCVIDGTNLVYYDKTGSLPDNIRFDYKQRRGILTEYYFRNIIDDTRYCVFGREAASIFYSRIDEVDPFDVNELNNRSNIPSEKFSDILGLKPEPISQLNKYQPPESLIQDDRQRPSELLTHVNRQRPSELLTHVNRQQRSHGQQSLVQVNRQSLSQRQLHSQQQSESIPPSVLYLPLNKLENAFLPINHHMKQDSLLDVCKPKRQPIIQPIKTSNVSLFGETQQRQDREKRKNTTESISYTSYGEIKTQSYKPELSYDQNINTYNHVDRLALTPDYITVIDKGVKITFPNPNYPIEVKTYYP